MKQSVYKKTLITSIELIKNFSDKEIREVLTLILNEIGNLYLVTSKSDPTFNELVIIRHEHEAYNE